MLKIIPVTALLSLAFLFPVQGFSQWRYDSIDRSLDRRGGSAAAPTKGPVVTNETARRTKEFRPRYGSRTRVYFLRSCGASATRGERIESPRRRFARALADTKCRWHPQGCCPSSRVKVGCSVSANREVLFLSRGRLTVMLYPFAGRVTDGLPCSYFYRARCGLIHLWADHPGPCTSDRQQVLRHKGNVGEKLLHCISHHVLHLSHRCGVVGTVGDQHQ